jgi:hypothetical protein
MTVEKPTRCNTLFLQGIQKYKLAGLRVLETLARAPMLFMPIVT